MYDNCMEDTTISFDETVRRNFIELTRRFQSSKNDNHFSITDIPFSEGDLARLLAVAPSTDQEKA